MFQTAPVKMRTIAPSLDAELAGGEERDHGEHDAGQKAEHRDRLQDVERPRS